MKLLKTLVIAMILNGCAVGPDYTPPPAPAAGIAFTESTSSSGYTNEGTSTDWWKSFGDDQLVSLVQRGVENNNTITTALSRLNQARSTRNQTFFDLFPTVTSGADYKISRSSVARLPQNGAQFIQRRYEIYSAGFDATWEIDLFGRVRRSLEANTALEEASEAGLQDALRIVQSDIAQYYLELRGLQNQLVVAERNAKNQEQTLQLTKDLVASGMSSDLDRARAEAQLKSTLSTIPSLRTSVKAAIHRLSVLVGKNPEELEPELTEPKAIPEYAGPVALGDAGALLLRRPDVRTAERQLAAATANIGITKADLYPRVSFIGSIDVEGRTTSDLSKRGAEAFSFGPSISWAAFDLGRVFARINGAEAGAEGAAANYHQTVLTALEEVENSLVQFTNERDRRQLLQDASKASNEAMSIAKERYQSGVSDFLTVLDAERVALQSEDALAQSEKQLSLSLLGIYKSLGGGWEGYITEPGTTPIQEVNEMKS